MFRRAWPTLRGPWVSFVVCAGLLLVAGCRGQSTSGPSPDGVGSVGPGEQPAPANPGAPFAVHGPVVVDSVGVDAGAGEAGDGGAGDAGPNCASAGDPFTGVDSGIDGGSSCMGSLGAATFQSALCSCGSLQLSGALTTDGYNSTLGSPDGGIGGNVGANGAVTLSSTTSVGGNLWTPSSIAASG